ncbi:MAG: hypothetical protein M0R22_11925 [Dehalococcoidia bacterium]|nr:hypothetical protein [Dehalococcoidia bacterium]
MPYQCNLITYGFNGWSATFNAESILWGGNATSGDFAVTTIRHLEARGCVEWSVGPNTIVYGVIVTSGVPPPVASDSDDETSSAPPGPPLPSSSTVHQYTPGEQRGRGICATPGKVPLTVEFCYAPAPAVSFDGAFVHTVERRVPWRLDVNPDAAHVVVCRDGLAGKTFTVSMAAGPPVVVARNISGQLYSDNPSVRVWAVDALGLSVEVPVSCDDDGYEDNATLCTYGGPLPVGLVPVRVHAAVEAAQGVYARGVDCSDAGTIMQIVSDADYDVRWQPSGDTLASGVAPGAGLVSTIPVAVQLWPVESMQQAVSVTLMHTSGERTLTQIAAMVVDVVDCW